VLQHIADVTAAPVTQRVGVVRLPDVLDVEAALVGQRLKMKGSGVAGSKNHGEKLEKRALAGTAFADEGQLRAAFDVEVRNLKLKLRAPGAVRFCNVAQREDRVRGQGRASSSRGYRESPSTGPPSSETQRSRLSCSAR